MLKKYIFLQRDDKICTCMFSNNSFEERLKDGESDFIVDDFSTPEFISWLESMVAEKEDDFIDFCIISDKVISENIFYDDKNKKWKKTGKSTWNISDIADFINEYVKDTKVQLIMTADNKGFEFGQGRYIKKFYCKCFPEFDFKDSDKVSLNKNLTNKEDLNESTEKAEETKNVVDTSKPSNAVKYINKVTKKFEPKKFVASSSVGEKEILQLKPIETDYEESL